MRSRGINVCAWIGLEVQDKLCVVEMAELQISFMKSELLKLQIGVLYVSSFSFLLLSLLSVRK